MTSKRFLQKDGLVKSVSCAGCAAKLNPIILRQALQGLKSIGAATDSNLLVGFDHADDAGVYLLPGKDLALVQTVDFFTPIVDDAFWFGRVAAANAISDVYAMGGRPLTALNIFCCPEELSSNLIHRILSGGIETLREAECTLVGGHSVKDSELKFGMAITGLINPKRVLSNDKAMAGDALVLTKKLGTGIATTAAKHGDCPESLLEESVLSMACLNKIACEVMLTLSSHACTDVTGFGLMGHLSEMARASKVNMFVDSQSVPIFDGVLSLVADEYFTRADKSNREYATPWTLQSQVSEHLQKVLFDPQTSGGLLISLPASEAPLFVKKMKERGEDAWIIGSVGDPCEKPTIFIR